jgi:hypothetical protein
MTAFLSITGRCFRKCISQADFRESITDGYPRVLRRLKEQQIATAQSHSYRCFPGDEAPISLIGMAVISSENKRYITMTISMIRGERNESPLFMEEGIKQKKEGHESNRSQSGHKYRKGVNRERLTPLFSWWVRAELNRRHSNFQCQNELLY